MYHRGTTRQSFLPTRLSMFLAAMLGSGLIGASLVGFPSSADQLPGYHLAAEDDEVILPGRVATAINRTVHSVDRAEAAIDDGDGLAAQIALSAAVANTRRATLAGLVQIDAVPTDPEAETTSGPDSVVAVLNLDQSNIIRLSGLFDNVLHRSHVVSSLNQTMAVVHNRRLQVLDKVIGLDPEGAGADYADGMADTVDAYTDEVAVLTEALKYDRLSKAARPGLQLARTRSINTQAKVVAAFGGGE